MGMMTGMSILSGKPLRIFWRNTMQTGKYGLFLVGFFKLPGLAGASETCIYKSGSKDRIVQIPYESIMDDWYLKLLKLL